MDVEPARRRADLALVEEDALGGAGDRGLDVGVVEHDVRALAAELERDALEVRAARRLRDQLADLGAAGEGDLVDVRVLGERGAGVAVARDDVQDAGRDAGLERELAEAQRAERRLLGRLEDDRAAGGERRADLPRRHQQREVPRDDLPDDADGLLERVGVELGAGDVGQRRRHGRAAELRRPAGHVPEEVGGERDIGGGARRPSALPLSSESSSASSSSVLGDQVAEPMDRAPALGRRHPRPRAFERAAGRLRRRGRRPRPCRGRRWRARRRCRGRSSRRFRRRRRRPIRRR